ncbi:MAG: rod shape-determining protein MreD [Pelagibacterales bacterium]|nr:rod shape-determining protein MreD [Pelagibacterales bacterium]
MAGTFKNIRIKVFQSLPLIILFYISFKGSAVVDFNLFSINISYILVYYWVLRKPDILGYGYIFLAGIIIDVVFGFPLGVNALSLLIVASVAAYIRVVTVRITLLNDWISFIPALLIANFIFFISLYFTDFPIDYLYLFKNSAFTFIFYPFLWIFFSLISKLIEL